MAKKLTRSQVLAQAVSGADDFTALRYLRQREETPKLQQLEASGAGVLHNVQGALLDIYYTLWAPEPTMKSTEETPKALGYWREMLESAVETTAYEQMHTQTQLQELASLVGTISMGESVLAMVPEEDQEKLQEMAEAEAEANAAGEQQAGAQAQAGAAAQALAALQEAIGDGEPSQQAQQAMAEAQSQMRQAQAQTEQAQMTLEQAKAQLEALSQELMGQEGSAEAKQKRTQIARIAQQAVQDAAEEVKEVSNLLQSWGIDPGELAREGAAEALRVVERMRQSPEFQRFKDLLGRMRHISQRKSRTNARSEGRMVPRTEYGKDIARAEPQELARLMHPATRLQALQSWMRGELRLTAQEFKQTLGKGPVVACEDGSSSMSGEKKLWSKAACLALAYYAKLEKRTFVWIHFGSKSSRLVVRVYKNGQLSPEQMLEIAETFLSSGTDFEVPLSKALEVIREKGLTRADIAMLTDGECAVSDAWLREFLTEKERLEVNVFTVLMDVGMTADATVREFSDRVEKVSAFTAEEAGWRVIAHLT